jgi:hypothetical protein
MGAMPTVSTRLKCPEPGCDREVDNPRFQTEEALIRPAGLTRKPLAVERTFAAKCPLHGEVWVTKEGHHVSSDETAAYEATEEWQEIAFAVRGNGRNYETGAEVKKETTKMNFITQILVGLGLAVLCAYVPTKWIGDPHQAMVAGLLAGMLAADVTTAIWGGPKP